ncbi:hypothetical protein MD484_g6322, partial [Candolleomyces efflorescens]
MAATDFSPAPPPTANDLPHSQRKRLLKSTRKIEAMLGATPLVLEIDVGPAFLDFKPIESASASRPPITPRTRAHRRRGQLFEGASSSSCSSSSDSSDDDKTACEDTASESEYVFVPISTPRAAYQNQNIPAAVSSPLSPSKKAGNRKRSKSEAAPKSKSKSNKTKPLPQPPMHVLDIPITPPKASADSRKTKVKAAKAPQALAQPVLFRLRSVPLAPSSSARSISSVSSANTSSPAHAKSASVTTLSGSNAPLSPLSSIFNAPTSQEEREAKEREMKRKKLAKVARTLGENVPPELVFGSGTQKERKASISKPARKTVRAHRPRSLSVPVAFPPISNIIIDTSADEENEAREPVLPPPTQSAPVPAVTVTTTPTPTASTFYQHHVKSHSHSVLPISSSPYRSQTRSNVGYYSAQEIGTTLASRFSPPSEKVAFSGLMGRHHGASASASALGYYPSHRAAASTSSAPYQPRAAASLDIDRPAGFNGYRSPADYVWGKKQKDAKAGEPEADWGHRKEREWSGEWNVKDMGDVVKKLRELKGR